jgi:hypothetical protein
LYELDPIKIIHFAQNNSCIPVPVRLKQIIETEGHRDMTKNYHTGEMEVSVTERMRARIAWWQSPNFKLAA